MHVLDCLQSLELCTTVVVRGLLYIFRSTYEAEQLTIIVSCVSWYIMKFVLRTSGQRTDIYTLYRTIVDGKSRGRCFYLRMALYEL